MTSKTNGWLRASLAAAIALAAAGCAVTLSDQDVTTIITHEAATPAAPLDNIGVVTLRGAFVPKDGGVPAAQFTAAEGNDHVRTLFPALLDAIPRVLADNGIHAAPIASEDVRGADIVAAMARYDYVLVISPFSSSGPKGMLPTHLSLDGQIYDRNHVSVWRGQIVLRTDHVSSPESPMYKWGADMADDAARTLLARLVKESIVRTGPSVARAAPLAPARPAAPPEDPADWYETAHPAIHIHSPAGAEIHLGDTVAQVRAALPSAPAPQISVPRLQTIWAQASGIIVNFGDGKAFSILYDPRSKATIEGLDIGIGSTRAEVEARLGAGIPTITGGRRWVLDARRELAISFNTVGQVGGIEIHSRPKNPDGSRR